MALYTLETVQDYILDARTLLLDKIYPYRYDDNSLLVAFNLALQRARFYRPDLFAHKGLRYVPSYSAVSGQPVPIEPQFRQAIVYGLCGHALMRDQESVQDERATMFLDAQEYMMTGQVSRPQVRGGTPPQGPNR